jgi:hypothetical protein
MLSFIMLRVTFPECRKTIMLSVVMLSVIMLSVIMVSVLMVSVLMLSVLMLSVLILSVLMLSVLMLSVLMLSVLMLSVLILRVVMLSILMLSVLAPFKSPNLPETFKEKSIFKDATFLHKSGNICAFAKNYKKYDSLTFMGRAVNSVS